MLGLQLGVSVPSLKEWLEAESERSGQKYTLTETTTTLQSIQMLYPTMPLCLVPWVENCVLNAGGGALVSAGGLRHAMFLMKLRAQEPIPEQVLREVETWIDTHEPKQEPATPARFRSFFNQAED